MTKEGKLLAELRKSPLDYRLALALLDPEYEEWRPQGKVSSRVEFVRGVPLLVVTGEGTCHILKTSDGAAAAEVAEAARQLTVTELVAMGRDAFLALRAYLTEGEWRLSRNYGLTQEAFRPHPSAAVRRLTPEGGQKLKDACKAEADLWYESTWRDFEYMVDGLPVSCYGAFDGEDLVGFCSANPMCVGVTEISWIYVRANRRRRGLASGLLTAQTQEAFNRGDTVGYYAGGAQPEVDGMVRKVGFRELLGSYRFIPSDSPDRWRLYGGAVED